MKIQKKKWMTFAAAALIATGVLGMTSLAAGRADLNANTGGPGEKASVDVSTGEKPGDTQERQQDQQTAVITQILAVAGTGDCNADISYYKKENGNWELKWTEKGYVGRNGITDNKKEGEDDIDIAKVILAVSTGTVKTYFMLTTGLLVIVCAGVILIKKYVI